MCKNKSAEFVFFPEKTFGPDFPVERVERTQQMLGAGSGLKPPRPQPTRLLPKEMSHIHPSSCPIASETSNSSSAKGCNCSPPKSPMMPGAGEASQGLPTFAALSGTKAF